MKKSISILLALAMLLSLAACGGNAASSAAPASAVSGEEAPASEAEEAPAAEAPEPASASEDPASTLEESAAPEGEFMQAIEDVDALESRVDVTYIEPCVSYPLTDEPITLTFYTNAMNNLLTYIETYNDHKLLPVIEERTGVRLDFHEASWAAYNDQFNLIVASGDYYDFMNGNDYSGGAVKAYEDEIIMDLSPMLDEYGANMKHAWEISGDTARDIMTDEGLYLWIPSINDLYQPIGGLSIRQDWLDELGLDAPHTVDEFYDTLVAFKNAYPCPGGVFQMTQDGKLKSVYGAFGINAVGLASDFTDTAPGKEIGLFCKDNKVYCSLTEDGYRDYIEFEHKLYADGLINPDFYSDAVDMNYQALQMANDDCGIFFGNADDYSTAENASNNPNANVVGIPPIVMNEGDEYHFGERPTYVGIGGTSITTTCKEPELALAFINYFFTEEGSTLASYGLEGESFTYDAEGNPQLTDLVLHNPDGMATNVTSMYYTFGLIPVYLIRERLWPGYLQKELDALNLWGQTVLADYVLPGVSLTTEESATYVPTATEINTYATEALLRFVVGDVEINDQNWTDFQDTCRSLGSEDCVAIYQAALDRYNKR